LKRQYLQCVFITDLCLYGRVCACIHECNGLYIDECLRLRVCAHVCMCVCVCARVYVWMDVRTVSSPFFSPSRCFFLAPFQFQSHSHCLSGLSATLSLSLSISMHANLTGLQQQQNAHMLSHAATRCNILQHAAICCNTLPDTLQQATGSESTAATRWNTPQQTLQQATNSEGTVATHCNTLQHAATYTATGYGV